MELSNNHQPFPEKGLISDLHATALKISRMTSRCMENGELSDDALCVVSKLGQRAKDAIEAIREVHQRV
ncbi:hypothetical protein [Mesorhizobium sp. L103C131B0]|uniref:hypothetical protein n=1 Tax=Mesorhizobium sp. L103C131B0 TaxID=1287089 RepID=UPI0003CFA6E1|nr:hypothetical protein [Mesorhizobium sp. L103C131B0]ESZ62724.1 hypothetical protein X729_10220 [Mesorhizobium sp. L103C131B0]